MIAPNEAYYIIITIILKLEKCNTTTITISSVWEITITIIWLLLEFTVS